MLNNENMILVNVGKHRCKQLLAREQEKEKPVIEYLMTNTELLSKIKKMIIDETKEYATYRLKQQNHVLKKTYSYQNVILLIMDFHAETIQAEGSKILTTKRYKICRVRATGQIQNSYNK